MLWLNYFKCTFKKNIKYLPSVILFTFIICTVLFVIISQLLISEDDKLIDKKVSVGLVGDVDDKYLKTGLTAIKSLDVSKNYLEIVVYDSNESAEDAVRKGDILGFLYLPDGFIRSVLRGENTSANYVSKNSANDLLPVVVNEVISTVSDFVIESQSGIFAMENFYIDNDLKNYSKDLKSINIKYITHVMSRDEMVKVTQLGDIGIADFGQYYMCVLIVLSVVLIGVMCSVMCVRRNMALPCLLESKGCGAFAQIISDFVLYTLIPVVSLFMVFIVCFAAAKYDTFAVFNEITDDIEFSVFFKILPAVFVICSLQFFVYELFSNIVTATLMQFVVSIGLAYVSGCIYPITFFPDGLRYFASVLPFGISLEYLEGVILNINNTESLGRCIFYILAFVFLSYIVRKFKLNRGAV